MTLTARMRWGTVVVLACAAVLSAGNKKDKAKPGGAQLIDSGSFGVFVKGQRVVTETFSVKQENDISIVKSQLKEIGSSASTGQRSDLEMTSSAELVKYEWTDGNSSLVVTPNNDFLLERITPSAGAKPAEQPFLMPSTSAILDNNFFVHREVLAWRYLKTNCGSEGGEFRCQKDPGEYGVLVPQDRTSMRVRLELVGREKVNIRGTERELLRLDLKGEAFSWALWVDDKDQFKLMRVLIPDDNTELVRD
ncbi:MAG: hypothetical protein WB628_11845 [Candidatus Sulfotelmatobacter sp.]